MQVIASAIADVKIIVPKIFGDERGYFMETFRDDWFKREVADVDFVQENHSSSKQGILRGLHYQTEHAQGKLIRVTQGEIFDVVVDLRRQSSTFGQWFGCYLNADNKHQLWVPAGFAHGFYVLSESAEIIYKCTDYYAPAHEHSICWNDADLAIDWPLLKGTLPTLSLKDSAATPFKLATTY